LPFALQLWSEIRYDGFGVKQGLLSLTFHLALAVSKWQLSNVGDSWWHWESTAKLDGPSFMVNQLPELGAC
jgi:hypothetical protein